MRGLPSDPFFHPCLLTVLGILGVSPMQPPMFFYGSCSSQLLELGSVGARVAQGLLHPPWGPRKEAFRQYNRVQGQQPQELLSSGPHYMAVLTGPFNRDPRDFSATLHHGRASSSLHMCGCQPLNSPG